MGPTQPESRAAATTSRTAGACRANGKVEHNSHLCPPPVNPRALGFGDPRRLIRGARFERGLGVLLAPMEAVPRRPFRAGCAGQGAALPFTGFLAADALPRGAT